jgi:putative ABC transport system ATP-binding protein
MISLEGIGKIYSGERGTVRALADVNLTIERGSFTVITGASGSGKTTLLSILGGLVRPTAGRVVFNGADVFAMGENELADHRNRHLGFVLQSFNLIPYLTVRENVMVPMIPARTGAGTRRARAGALLDRLGLREKADFLPRELSVGQQQRVAIARALANDPKLVLADEPTGNLDPGLSRDVLKLFGSLNRDGGRTIVLVTHNADAVRYGTRSMRLVDGACSTGKRPAA